MNLYERESRAHAQENQHQDYDDDSEWVHAEGGTRGTFVSCFSSLLKIKWSGLFIIIMIVLPNLYGAWINISDVIWYEEMKIKRVEEGVTACYELYNVAEKKSVENVMRRYRGREGSLVYRMRSKYPRCSFFFS
jgi:hypothetical protein